MISDFWQYFEPIRQQCVLLSFVFGLGSIVDSMPANCSADVAAVVAHFDKTFTGKNKTAIDNLKATFGMEEMSHLDDVAGSRASFHFLAFPLNRITD
jgi:hypothetical protein